MSLSRRNFIKTTAIGSAALAGAMHLNGAYAFTGMEAQLELYTLSHNLMEQWLAALMKLQIRDKSIGDDYGGIFDPADKVVHGRCGDTIYPLLYMADKTKDSKYVDSAELLFRYMQRRLSQPDGSWLNEPVKGSWKGTTVFSAISLAEAISRHGSTISPQFNDEISARLLKAGNYIHDNFNMDYGNINYPVTASYGLTLLGTVLDVPKFNARGKELAHQAMNFITKKDGLLYGEGDPLYQTSPKGCFSIDLGYNVEESLSSLVLYGLGTNDEEVLGQVTRSMQGHMEFMLPDGGWDNSWGTRNYKWTYWGSRTSDGCQPAYALMAHRDPRFYKVALKNTQLLQECTKDGLLYGGPHSIVNGQIPWVHHTFSHIKGLTTLLDHGNAHEKLSLSNVSLPREKVYGSRFFSDIQTWLIAKGKYRATVTGYDREYKKTKGGHATGGALSMLWHEKSGPVFTASMNEYQLLEAGNQQPDNDPHSMPLTPRIELKQGGVTYMNISDLAAKITIETAGDKLVVNTLSKLVDKDQKSPATGEINCRVSYIFADDKVTLKFDYDKTTADADVKVIFPVISKSTDHITNVSGTDLNIRQEKCTIKVLANHPIIKLPTPNGRIFNYVPGLEAIPLAIAQNEAIIEITIV